MSDTTDRARHQLLVRALVVLGVALVGATVLVLEWKRRQARLATQFDAALAAADRRFVPAQSVLASVGTATRAEARAALELVRASVLDLESILGRLSPPQVERSLALRSLTERLRLQREALDADERAEEAFIEAVDIVQTKDVSRYSRALAELEKTAGSRFEADARVYRNWVLADTKVREAAALSRQGDREAARALLRSALETEGLHPEAKELIRRRLGALDETK